MADDLVLDGSYVVIQRYQRMFLKALKADKALVQVSKDMVDFSPVFSQAFNTCYKMVPNAETAKNPKGHQKLWDLVKVQPGEEVVDLVDKFASGEGDYGQDNRGLRDTDEAQAMKIDDVEEMKADQAGGEEIIGKLIENSSSFEAKTKFSQMKWVKRKAKKYSQYIVIRKPTIRLLQEINYKADPGKILSLRIDSLARIVNLANVRHGGNYMVYETGCQGLVVATCLERVVSPPGLEGTHGKVIHLYQTGQPHTNCIQAMNFTQDQLKNHYLTLNMYHMRSLEEGVDLINRQKDDADPKKVSRRNMREVSVEAYNVIKDKKMDGLVIACKTQPKPILLYLMKYLNPSRPFAVFCPYKEPLLDAFMAVKMTGKVVMAELSETWLRDYQVLPSRTHPKMRMSGGSGYLLTGIYVDNTEPEGYTEFPEKEGSGKKPKRFRK